MQRLLGPGAIVLAAGAAVGVLLRSDDPPSPPPIVPRQVLAGVEPTTRVEPAPLGNRVAAARPVTHSAGATPPPAKPPEPQAVERLEALLDADDHAGLRSFVLDDRSWARFEAFRQLLERGGRDELPGLLPLFDQDAPVVHGLLGDACAAGGDAPLAERLAAGLAGWEGGAQRAAAGAVLAIDADPARGQVSAHARRAAVETLTAQATRADPLSGEAACDALARGRADTVAAPLRALASDRGLDPGVRLAAIEALPDDARGPLCAALAADHPSHPVGRLAARIADRAASRD